MRSVLTLGQISIRSQVDEMRSWVSAALVGVSSAVSLAAHDERVTVIDLTI